MMSDEAQVAEAAPESAPEATSQEQDTILDGVEAATPESTEEPEQLVDTPENPDARPEWLPEKFKTPEDLVKAYNEMGAKIREKTEPPESYDIQFEDGTAIDLTESDVETFKKAGMTNDQVKVVTEYFYNEIMPSLVEAKTNVEKSRLAMEWGMDANSNEFQQQLGRVKAWANQNLPDAAVTELSRTAQGVQTIAKLMEQGSRGSRAVGESVAPRPGKADLANLMNDERYWNGDEDYREYVRQQFERAYD